MTLCSDGHEEICYDSRHCPLCEAKKEIAQWEKEENKLKLRIEQLEEAAAEEVGVAH